MKTLNWHRLYANGWKGEIVPDAFSHPAKFSRKLIQHIYAHLFARGWLHEGETVLDPFGGVALGALDAMTRGCHWTGVELEPKFVALGEQNIALWQTRYKALPHFGTARIVQGDSRRLREVVEGAACVVSSPPYADGAAHTGGDDLHPERLQGGVYHGVGLANTDSSTRYGHTPGNLANLRADEAAFAAVVASPPYAEGLGHGGTPTQGGGKAGDIVLDAMQDGYGTTPGQLGAMRPGDVDAVVSSPPFIDNSANDIRPIGGLKVSNHHGVSTQRHYGTTDGQLGLESPDTFWSAARTIVGECHALLKPGGVAVWVVKSFVRHKAIVDFPGQWRTLCEAVGFETVEVARAWLVEDHGTQLAQDGKHKRMTKKRVSFFRRLAESKGSPAIDWETVLFMVKR